MPVADPNKQDYGNPAINQKKWAMVRAADRKVKKKDASQI
jgi:hypothetical protein